MTRSPITDPEPPCGASASFMRHLTRSSRYRPADELAGLRDQHASDHERSTNELDRRQRLAEQQRRKDDRVDRLDRADERCLGGADPPRARVERLQRDRRRHDADADQRQPRVGRDLRRQHRVVHGERPDPPRHGRGA